MDDLVAIPRNADLEVGDDVQLRVIHRGVGAITESDVNLATVDNAIVIGFNVTYLVDALANMSAEMITIALQDSNSSALITIPEQSGFKYVVMPMRI